MNTQEQITFSPIVVGVMRLGTWGANLSSQEMENYIDQCLDLGITDFDHADIYGDYTEETHFGEVIKGRSDLKDKVEIITKCGIRMLTENRPDHKVTSYDSTKAHILASVDNSLASLGIDQIKLLLLHRPDYLLNPNEVTEAFEQLRSAGKVLHFGVSNYTTSQFDLLNSFTPLVTNQIEFSPTHLQPLDDGTLDQSLKLNFQPMAWSPFGGGEIFSSTDDPSIKRIQQTAQKLSEKYNAGVDQILLAWVMKHPSAIVPVVGSTKIERIASALEATDITLTNEEWYELLEAARGQEVA